MNAAIPVVLSIIKKDDSILLLKRTKDPFKNLWSIPGGKIHSDEYVTDAAKRECTEETNLTPEKVTLLGIISELVKENNDIYKGHLIQVFLCENCSGKMKDSPEGPLKWFTLDEINNNRDSITPTDLFMLEKLLINPEHKAYNCIVEKVGDIYNFVGYEKINF